MKVSQSLSVVAVVLSVQALSVHLANVNVPKQYFVVLFPTMADSQKVATPM